MNCAHWQKEETHDLCCQRCKPLVANSLAVLIYTSMEETLELSQCSVRGKAEDFVSSRSLSYRRSLSTRAYDLEEESYTPSIQVFVFTVTIATHASCTYHVLLLSAGYQVGEEKRGGGLAFSEWVCPIRYIPKLHYQIISDLLRQ